MGQLRERMYADLTLRRYSQQTIRKYVPAVALFVAFFGCSPRWLGEAEIRRFLLHLVEEKKAGPAANRHPHGSTLAGFRQGHGSSGSPGSWVHPAGWVTRFRQGHGSTRSPASWVHPEAGVG